MAEPHRIVIGSRESKLAVAQSNLVIAHLQARYPHASVELATFKTTGDKILDRRLDQIGGKGLFVKELDAALRDGRADYTVHSCKDLPMEIPVDLPLVCFSKREDPRDVIVYPQGADEPDFSKPIGTCSLRRELQLAKIYPQASFASIRGNLQTRLRKLDEGEYGAIVLAAAGLVRMGMESRIGRRFEPDEIIPSAGQGIIAVQGRTDADASLFEGYANAEAATAALAERAFVARLDGGCSSPIAAHARTSGESVELLGLYYDGDARQARRGTVRGSTAEAVEMARNLADELKAGGGQAL